MRKIGQPIDDATVLDEGQTRQGTDAIRAWRAEVADLQWDFTVADDRIPRLAIAP